MIGARIVGDAQISQDKPAENLHSPFFDGVSSRSKANSETTVESILVVAGITRKRRADPKPAAKRWSRYRKACSTQNAVLRHSCGILSAAIVGRQMAL